MAVEALSTALLKWAFVANDRLLDDILLEDANAVLLLESANITANVFVVIALLEKGMIQAAKSSAKRCRDYFVAMSANKNNTISDGDNMINLSTLSLFASVLMGAISGFSDFPITDMLTSTQEALKRAAGDSTRK